MTRMWEEHPEYQKQQMLLVGISLLLLFVVLVGGSIIEQQWDFLRFILLIAGCLLFSLALLSGTAWLIVRIVTRRGARSNAKKEISDA